MLLNNLCLGLQKSPTFLNQHSIFSISKVFMKTQIFILFPFSTHSLEESTDITIEEVFGIFKHPFLFQIVRQ